MWCHHCHSSRKSSHTPCIFFIYTLYLLYAVKAKNQNIIFALEPLFEISLNRQTWWPLLLKDHRVSIDRKCPYIKKLKGKVTSPHTLTIMTSHTYKCQIFVLHLAKQNESCEEKLFNSILLNKIVSKQID